MLLKILQKQQRTRTRTFCGRSRNRQFLSDSGRNWSWIESLFLGVSSITQSSFADKSAGGRAAKMMIGWRMDRWIDSMTIQNYSCCTCTTKQRRWWELWHSNESSDHLAESNQIRCKQTNKQTNRLSTRSTKLPFYTACFVCCLAGAVRVSESATGAPRLSDRVYFRLPGEGGEKKNPPIKFKETDFFNTGQTLGSQFFFENFTKTRPFPSQVLFRFFSGSFMKIWCFWINWEPAVLWFYFYFFVGQKTEAKWWFFGFGNF